MLSYKKNVKFLLAGAGRSPRQLWNALLPKQNVMLYIFPSRSPRQLWNALLQTKCDAVHLKSNVAVPVNYGMLSYIIITN